MYREGLKPNDILAKLTTIFMIVLLSVYVLCILSFMLYISAMEEGGYYDARPYGVFFAMASLLSIVVYLGVVIVFLLWFSRAYHNLQRLGKSLNHGVFWSVLGWFIPIMWWFRPWEIYGEMGETYPVIAKAFPDRLQKDTPTKDEIMRVGGYWWGTYVVFSILGNVVNFYNSNTIDNFWDIFPVVVMLIPGLLLIRMVRKFAKLEAVIFKIWVTGEYSAFVEAREAARAAKSAQPGDGKSANWYKTEAENEKNLNRNEDPFS